MEGVEGVRIVKVDGEDTKKELVMLKEMLRTSYGPWSHYSLIQSSTSNSIITLTRRSNKILQHLETKNPLIKTIIAHLQGHAHRQKESTLYAGILACNLVLQGLEVHMTRRRVVMAIDHTLSVLMEWLQLVSCPVKYEMKLSSVDHLVSLLYSYLGSKMSMCCHQDLHHLCTLLLKAFLQGLPPCGNKTKNISEHLYIVPLPSMATHFSILCEGLLLSEEVWSPFDHTPLKMDGCILTAVFDISLAGDLPQGTDLRVMGLNDDLSVEELILEELLNLGRVLVEKGVGLLACQKCVHPILRDYLQKEHVVVLERLSSVMIGPVHKLSGGGALFSSTSCHTLRTATFGTISDIQPFQCYGHRFLQLKGVSELHSTLLLCSESERNLDELQPLCRDAMCVLSECVGDDHVMAGGGCTDTIIAHYIRTKVAEPVNKVQSSDVMMVADGFEVQAASLDHYGSLVATDPVYHHCWYLPRHGYWDHEDSIMRCNCGAISISDVLPRYTGWKALASSDQDELDSFPFMEWMSVASSNQEIGRPQVFDLWTPKIAAIECAFGLSRTLLSLAYAVSAL